MADLDIRQIAVPVFGTKTLGEVPIELCGTAFGIGPGIFMTAGHVVRRAFTHPTMSLGFIPEGVGMGPCGSTSAVVEEHEVHEHVDLAIIRCAGGPHVTVPWSTMTVDLLTDVIAGGYPHALDREAKELLVRIYRGHVVSARPLRTLPAKPLAYELSFSCPVGMSGAPLLTRTLPPKVLGMVVQNGRSGMLVATDAEVVNDSRERTVIERYEYLTFGLAVASPSILTVESKLLGTTVARYLERQSGRGA